MLGRYQPWDTATSSQPLRGTKGSFRQHAPRSTLPSLRTELSADTYDTFIVLKETRQGCYPATTPPQLDA